MTLSARHILVWLAAALFGAASLVAVGPARTSGPASPLSPVAPTPLAATDDLEAQMARRLGQLVEVLRAARDDESRAAARRQILALQKACLEALLARADDADPEVRARVRALLDLLVSDARVQRTLAILPPDQRRRLQRLREERPEIFEDMFSNDQARRVRAMDTIARMKDPDALAEPLLVMCLNHPSRRLVDAAARAAVTGRYRSDALVAALCRVLARTSEWDWRRAGGYGYYDPDGSEDATAQPHWTALEALMVIRSPHAAGPLLAILGQKNYDAYRNIMIGEALIASGERRAIPTLLDMLDDRGMVSSWSNGDTSISLSRGDVALMILVRLTRQNPASYGFAYHTSSRPYGGESSVYGFSKDTDRQTAVQKFRNWWNSHKDAPPYNEIQPLPTIKAE